MIKGDLLLNLFINYYSLKVDPLPFYFYNQKKNIN
jgi:hypothetical protein